MTVHHGRPFGNLAFLAQLTTLPAEGGTMSSINRPRLLVVDDEDSLRRSLSRALKQTFRVVEASNGHEAVRLMESGELFEVVLTDLEMPGMTGDQLFGWIELNRPALARRVVVLTGGAKEDHLVKWLRAFDPTRVLTKPCTFDSILNALQFVLRDG